MPFVGDFVPVSFDRNCLHLTFPHTKAGNTTSAKTLFVHKNVQLYIYFLPIIRVSRYRPSNIKSRLTELCIYKTNFRAINLYYLRVYLMCLLINYLCYKHY